MPEALDESAGTARVAWLAERRLPIRSGRAGLEIRPAFVVGRLAGALCYLAIRCAGESFLLAAASSGGWQRGVAKRGSFSTLIREGPQVRVE